MTSSLMAMTSAGKPSMLCNCQSVTHVLFVHSDELVGNATNGQTSANGVTYTASVATITGLLPTGTAGINHGAYFISILKAHLLS